MDLMKLLKALEANTAALEANTAALGAKPAPKPAPAPAQEPAQAPAPTAGSLAKDPPAPAPAPAPKPKPKPKPKTKPPQADTGDIPTGWQHRVAVLVAKSLGKPAAVDLLSAQNVSRTGELKGEGLVNFVTEAEALLTANEVEFERPAA